MTDDGSTRISKMSEVQLAIAIFVVVVASFIVILVFTASPRVANALTAGGTQCRDDCP